MVKIGLSVVQMWRSTNERKCNQNYTATEKSIELVRSNNPTYLLRGEKLNAPHLQYCGSAEDTGGTYLLLIGSYWQRMSPALAAAAPTPP